MDSEYIEVSPDGDQPETLQVDTDSSYIPDRPNELNIEEKQMIDYSRGIMTCRVCHHHIHSIDGEDDPFFECQKRTFISEVKSDGEEKYTKLQILEMDYCESVYDMLRKIRSQLKDWIFDDFSGNIRGKYIFLMGFILGIVITYIFLHYLVW